MPIRAMDATVQMARASSSSAGRHHHGARAHQRPASAAGAPPPLEIDTQQQWDGQQIHQSPSVVTLNKNVSFISHKAFWFFYLGLVGVAWLALAALLDDAGLAWTYTHLLHGAITYYLFHVTKGTPFVDDATDHGRYQALTFWEQVDSAHYGTRNRKLLTVVPAVLFVLATHGADFSKQPLGLNLAVAVLLVVAKLPALHKVRIFGINKY